jgi:hypothetical protein
MIQRRDGARFAREARAERPRTVGRQDFHCDDPIEPRAR